MYAAEHIRCRHRRNIAVSQTSPILNCFGQASGIERADFCAHMVASQRAPLPLPDRIDYVMRNARGRRTTKGVIADARPHALSLLSQVG